MAKQPKSAAVEQYRREIATYLEAVRLATGWKNVEMGQKAGDLAHTTIGRARKGENTLGFPALMALEAASGVTIPESLRAAAIQAQQPTRPEPETHDEWQDVLETVARDLTKDQRAALLRKLQRELAKAG